MQLTFRLSVTMVVIRAHPGALFPLYNVPQVSMSEELAVSTGLISSRIPLLRLLYETHLIPMANPLLPASPWQVEINVPLVLLKQPRKFRRQGRLVCRTAVMMTWLLTALMAVLFSGALIMWGAQDSLPETLHVATLLTCLRPWWKCTELARTDPLWTRVTNPPRMAPRSPRARKATRARGPAANRGNRRMGSAWYGLCVLRCRDLRGIL